MESRLKNQPKYKIGQTVLIKVDTTHKSGLTFSNVVEMTICSIYASGTSEKDTYEYGVTNDMPGCYHAGKLNIFIISEDNIVLKKEEQV